VIGTQWSTPTGLTFSPDLRAVEAGEHFDGRRASRWTSRCNRFRHQQGVLEMKCKVSLTLAVLLVMLGFSPKLKAQVAGASLSGTVTDVSGGAIANAQVSAKNTATAVVTTGAANSDGYYDIANLLPGDYEVTVSAPNFNSKATQVTLTVGAKQVFNISLVVGHSTEVVQVSESAPTVELATSTISSVVEGAEVRELPLNGRDWASLATLQPGVVSVRTQEQVQQIGSHARGLGLQMSIGGARPTQNSYRLNGMIINDYSNAGPGSVLGQNLGVDAIQEFSVLTSDYSAEYGYSSGGIINAITRSGTNQFHGSAYEFLRNSALDAANFFENAANLKKAPFRRNQFGGSAGGPIWKDKIFVFGDYEGLRQSKGITNIADVPSAEARRGFLGDSTTGAPLVPITVDPNIAKYLTFYPAPNAGLHSPGNGATCNQTTVICNTGKYAFSGGQVVPENYYTTRADVKVTDKDSLNGSWYYDRSSFTQPDSLNQVLDQFLVGRQGATLEETHLFGSRMSNTARFGYNRSYADGQLTVKAINPAAADTAFGMGNGLFAPRTTVPGLTVFGGGLKGQSVQNYLLETYQFFDDATRNFGKHDLKFGVMVIRYHENLFAPFREDGVVTFSTLSDFLTNNVHRASAPPNLANIREHNLVTTIPAVYIQDDWKIRPNLTLNLGLRYEMETIPTETHGLVDNLPTPSTDPGGQNCPNCQHVFFTKNPTNKNFEPRLGFAWDPFHNGKTAVRGGFGIFDSLPLPYELVINNAQTSPFNVTGSASACTNGVTTGCIPQGAFPNNGILALLTNPAVANQTWNYVEPAPHRNYVYQYNLNIQRQVGSSTSITVAYSGSRGLHNPTQMDDINTVFPYRVDGRWLFPNPSCAGPNASATCFAPGPGIVAGHPVNAFVSANGSVQTTLWESMSYYNALQVQVLKRMSHGFQVQGAFTWSKTMDTSSGSFAGDNFAGDVSPTVPWWDLRITRGLSDFNVGRNLVINALYDIPVPQSFHGPLGWITRGWQIGGILTLSDGVPAWPLSPPGQGADLMGQNNSEPISIPDRVPGCTLTNPSSGRHGTLQYINPACFTNPIAPTQAFFSAAPPLGCDTTTIPIPAGASPLTCFNLLGNLGRNTVIGPGLFNLDYSMVKNSKVPRISETFAIQFRAEFFNVLNHANFALPNVNNLSPFDGNGQPVSGFGQLTATQSPERQIQFALKLIW
jgi:hypothetical protein